MPRNELFLGNLARDVTRKDIEGVFEKYGRLLRCDLKNRGFGANFAFLEFEDERDAEDALKGEHGKDMCGSSMVVEWAKSKGDRDRRNRFGDRRDGGRDGRSGGGRDGGRDGGFRPRGGRDGGSGGGRSLECYECGERGHFARDCRKAGSGGGGSGGRRDRGGRDGGRSDRRDNERRYNDRSKSRSMSRSKSRSHSRSKSRSE